MSPYAISEYLIFQKFPGGHAPDPEHYYAMYADYALHNDSIKSIITVPPLLITFLHPCQLIKLV